MSAATVQRRIKKKNNYILGASLPDGDSGQSAMVRSSLHG